MATAFEGVKILELCTGIAGPYMSMMFCDMGAEVIKIEPVTGDSYRSEPGFVVINRGKKGLKLDFTKPVARGIFDKLLSQIDILIVDFNSEQYKCLDIDYVSLMNKYPRLILCSVSFWRETGPLVDKPGTPNLIAAYNGVTSSQASFSGDPMFMVMPISAFSAAQGGAISVIGALIYREISGRGQKVEVSLFGIGGLWGENTTQAIRNLTTPYGHAPIYRIYQAKDGWIQIAAGNPAFCGKLFIAMGQELLISDPRFVNLPWGVVNLDHRKELEQIIGTWVSQYTREEVIRILEENDVPCGLVRTVEEFSKHPQLVYAHKVIELDDPNVGKVQEMGLLVELSGTPGKIKGPSPSLGQHSQEVLQAIGFSPSDVKRLHRDGVI